MKFEVKDLPIPKPVEEVINRYKMNDKDKYKILPLKIFHHDQYYYYIHFEKRDRFLVVTEDGRVPSLDESKPVINNASKINASFTALTSIEKNLIRKLDKKIDTFSKFHRFFLSLKEECRVSEDALLYLKEFIYVIETMLRKYQIILEIYPPTEALLKDVLSKQFITSSERVILQKNQLLITKYSIEADLEQLESVGARELFLRSSRKHISIFKYLRAKSCYNKMLNYAAFLDVFKKEYEDIKKRLEKVEQVDYYSETVLEIFSKTLNGEK